MSTSDQQATTPDFAGKLLWIFNDAGVVSDVGNLVSNARFENQAGRLFIVGLLVEFNYNWTGTPVAIAWDTVAKYIVLDSVNDFHQRRASNTPQVKRGWFGKA